MPISSRWPRNSTRSIRRPTSTTRSGSSPRTGRSKRCATCRRRSNATTIAPSIAAVSCSTRIKRRAEPAWRGSMMISAFSSSGSTRRPVAQPRPGSAAAHRFLSDTYQGVRRREISGSASSCRRRCSRTSTSIQSSPVSARPISTSPREADRPRQGSTNSRRSLRGTTSSSTPRGRRKQRHIRRGRGGIRALRRAFDQRWRLPLRERRMAHQQ